MNLNPFQSVISESKPYSRKSFFSDLLAGLTVAVITIPQGMAYALLAGVDAVYGLYTAFIAMLIYPFFGSARTMIVGPVALISITLFSGISPHAEPGTEEYLQLILLVSLMAGITQVLMSLFKIGDLSKLLAKPVMSGFIAAAGIIVILSQLKYVLGLDLPRSSTVVGMITQVFSHLREIHWLSFGLGVGALVILRLLRLLLKRIPGALVVVLGGTILVYLLQLEVKGVSVVGFIESGYPSFYFGFLKSNHWIELLPTAIAVSLLCFIGSYSIAKNSESKYHKGTPIDSNRELWALGLTKVVGSFFYNFASTGSFSRTAVADEQSAQSGFTSIIAGFIVAVFIIFFGQLLHYVPIPVLSAIVISSVFGLIDFSEMMDLYRIDKRDFWVWVATFLLTLLIGIQNGVFAGIIVSFIFLIAKISRPEYAVMGQISGTTIFRNIARYKNAITDDRILVIRIESDILFVNAEQLYLAIEGEIEERPDCKVLILDLAAVIHVDSSGLEYLEKLNHYLRDNHITLMITGAKGHLRDYFSANGFTEAVGQENFYPNINRAMTTCKAIITTEADE